MTTPIKAIKDHCKNTCCCGDAESWKNCTITTCALYSYRLGHNPARQGKGGDGGAALEAWRNQKNES